MCQLDVKGRQTKFSIDKVKLYRRSPDGKTDGVQNVEGNAPDNGTSTKGSKSNEDPLPLLSLESQVVPNDDEEVPQIGHPLDEARAINRWRDTFVEIEIPEL